MKKKYDWNALKTEFVTGDISAAALAKKYKINYQTLYRHYQIGRWNEVRREYLESVVEKCADKAADIAAIKLAKELDIANKLSGVLDSAVTDEKQFRRYIVSEKCEGGTQTEERVFEKIDMRSLHNAIKALRSLEEIKSIMYGIVPPAQERRLKIEESKLSSTAEHDDEETGVVILPEISNEEETNA